MKELFQAILTYYNAATTSDFYSSMGGANRLYLHQAPWTDANLDAIDYPYTVFRDVARVPEYFFCTQMQEEVLIQFDIFGDTTESALNITTYAEELHDLFDDADLTLTNYGCLQFQRDLSNLLIEDEGDQRIWHHITQYIVLLELK